MWRPRIPHNCLYRVTKGKDGPAGHGQAKLLKRQKNGKHGGEI